MGTKYFEHRLTEAEIKKVRLSLPMTQADVTHVQKCHIQLNKKMYPNGVCAITEHMIIFLKKGWTNKFIIISQHYLFNVRNVTIINKGKIGIMIQNLRVIVESEDLLEFVRLLIRNYTLITQIWPSKMCLQLKTSSPNDLPPFRPNTSLSEMFQLTYNAYCSYFETDYFHDVVRFFHTMISTGNAIADFSNLPLSVIDTNFMDPLSLRPVITTYLFCPMVYGYMLHDVARPDFLKAIAPLVQTNKICKFIQCSRCAIREGIIDLAKAMINNPQSTILFYDLSNNPIADISKFAFALSKVKNKILYINVNKTCKTQTDALNFMKSFACNQYMMSVRYFYMNAAPVYENAIDFFVQYLENCTNRNALNLKALDVGRIISGDDKFFMALKKNPVPIEYLAFENSYITKKGFDALISFIHSATNLKELDISGITFTIQQILTILDAINKNDLITEMKLHMNGIQSIGAEFPYLADYFSSTKKCDKFTGLYFNRVGIKSKMFMKFNVFFDEFRNLTHLEFGGNWGHKDKQLFQCLELLTSIETIEFLGLQGTDSCYLGERGCEMLCKLLKKNKNIIELDLSDNKIGDNGIDNISNLLESNETIRILKLDGSKPNSLVPLTQLFSIVSSHPSLCVFPWPCKDVYDFIENVKEKKRQIILEDLSYKQRMASENMEKNLNKFGYHSNLSLLEIPEIDYILDECTLEFHDIVSKKCVNKHSSIIKDFGLDYPHVDENAHFKGAKITFPPHDDCYDAKRDEKGYQENSLDLAHTRQLESLRMRREDLVGRVRSFVARLDGEEEFLSSISSEEEDEKKPGEEAGPSILAQSPPQPESLSTTPRQMPPPAEPAPPLPQQQILPPPPPVYNSLILSPQIEEEKKNAPPPSPIVVDSSSQLPPPPPFSQFQSPPPSMANILPPPIPNMPPPDLPPPPMVAPLEAPPALSSFNPVAPPVLPKVPVSVPVIPNSPPGLIIPPPLNDPETNSLRFVPINHAEPVMPPPLPRAESSPRIGSIEIPPNIFDTVALSPSAEKQKSDSDDFPDLHTDSEDEHKPKRPTLDSTSSDESDSDKDTKSGKSYSSYGSYYSSSDYYSDSKPPKEEPKPAAPPSKRPKMESESDDSDSGSGVDIPVTAKPAEPPKEEPKPAEPPNGRPKIESSDSNSDSGSGVDIPVTAKPPDPPKEEPKKPADPPKPSEVPKKDDKKKDKSDESDYYSYYSDGSYYYYSD